MTTPYPAFTDAPALVAGASAGSATADRRAAAVMFASGCAGLGYQVVWTRQCALWLGHEAASVLAVITAFFGGLALGAALLGRRIERSPYPARWYAACEVVIALWAVVLALALPALADAMSGWTGPEPTPLWQAGVAFGGCLLALLPATVAMGATLPALARVVATPGRAGSAMALLYACNTGGAVLGVLATAFWLLPQWGLLRTAAACAALNLACAVAVWRLPPGATPMAASAGVSAGAPSSASSPAPSTPRRQSWHVLAILALTGLLGISYEVLVVRVLSQVAQNTVYTYAQLLAVYLVATALGAAACRRWLRGGEARGHDPGRLRDRLLAATAAACLVGGASLWGAQALRDALQPHLPGLAGALATEALLAFAAFGLPALAMGALFSLLVAQADEAGWGFSSALAVNTLGAAAAPVVAGVLLLPAVGAKAALLTVVAGYLLPLSVRAWRRGAGWAVAAPGAVVAAMAPPLVFVDVPEGGRVVSYREGVMAAVSVVEDGEGVLRLRIDNRQQEGSNASAVADGRQALLPLLLHPAPRRALFLGLGTGVTAAAAAADPGLQVTAAELLPEVIEASALFTPPGARLHVVAADARRTVRAAGSDERRWDVIVSDNFHPARSGSGALYTVEHFAAVRRRLAPGGLFCQWLPLHQMDLATLRSIVRSFLQAYPQGQAMLATNSLATPVLGLVGGTGPLLHAPGVVRQRVATASPALRLADHALDDATAVLGSFVAGPGTLAAWAGDAPLNTDDHTVVAYLAPRITYAPDSTPAERLLVLQGAWQPRTAELLASDTPPAETARLVAWWRARSAFLAAGHGVHALGDVHRMLAQVREPLLAVLRISPEFRPAYDPLLGMAGALSATDPAAARSLLRDLQAVQPARPEAGALLRRLGGAVP